MWRKGNPPALLVGIKLVQPLWRTVWRWKLYIELPYDPAMPILGTYLDKTFLDRDTCTHMFTAALFTIGKTWKQPKCLSTDEWIKKMWHIYTMEYYSAIKKNKRMPFAAIWMELETHTEWRKSERERQIPYDITYIWNLIYGPNEPFHRKENHGLGEQTCGCQGGGGGNGRDWELVVNRCRILSLGWISNGILLCSTGNSVESLRMEPDDVRKKNVYVCLTGSPCCTAEKNINKW